MKIIFFDIVDGVGAAGDGLEDGGSGVTKEGGSGWDVGDEDLDLPADLVI